MKINDTISVNPSKKTLGHVETPVSSIFRSPVIGVDSARDNVDILQLVFPTTKSGLAEYEKFALPIRTLFATILIVTGITLLSASASVALGICSLCFGGCLAIGLFTRPVMLGASVFYCITGALALRAGSPDLLVFSLMFGSLIFAMMGSGKYSCDFLIRSSIKRAKRRSESRRRENALSYKAFHNLM
ncbi:MAG: hypothetical protein J1D77_08305 [Muribaculaceae bacterium]|nr:hypothetical protein [Muribaculaceae bacterium]